MNYKTVFEITEKGLDITSFVPLIMFIAIVLIIILNNKFNPEKLKKKMPFLIVLSIIFFIVAICVLAFTFEQRNKINKVYQEKSFSVVCGEIKDFQPAIFKGKKEDEHFTVNDVYFEYNDYEQVYGFNNSSTLGGPIYGNGQEVRISYIPEKKYNRILKVEIKVGD